MNEYREQTHIKSGDVTVGAKAKTRARHGGHGLHMILCVAAMAGALWFLRGSSGGSGYWMLFILACPLMHLFMGHGSHGNHQAHDHDEERKNQK